MIAAGLIVLGLAGLVVGGEMLVRGAVSTARAFRISPMVIGLTLVGFGTSTPELVTSLHAALSGAPGIAIGNVIGSNTANVLLILGLAALVAPIAVAPAALWRDGTAMLIATALCLAIVLLGQIGRAAGLGLVLALIGYLTATLLAERRASRPGGGPGTPSGAIYAAEAEAVPGRDPSLAVSVALAVVGLAVTILGARLLVSGAVTVAEAAGFSQTVIGLTIVAIGTSMPELVTAVIAVRRGQGEVALGNVLGSNIFNILGILGLTALVQPMAVPPEILRLDIWVMCAAAVLLVVCARTGWRVGRREGAAMLAGYAAYLGWLLL